MKLFILRHGQAESFAATDAERALTEQGRREVARMAATVKAELAGVEQLWVSPYRRAQETARTVLEELSLDVVPVTTDLLVPEAQPEALYQSLQQCACTSVLLVSHQPFVGRLLHNLCDVEPGRYAMGTASLASLEVECAAKGLAELQWLRHSAGLCLT